ncbi:MAG: DNA-binding response regulator [Clostridiales bacterium]|nr:MAG: DNA-binding response regulator [Clostridiales bacterium]
MIYYVEDDENIRELVVYTLNQTGMAAVGFSDAKEFKKALVGAVPELILLDIMLPGEDGLSILRHLKDDARTAYIPVIMVTAKDTEYDKVTGLDGGADDYISKPFGMMELVARVKALLRRTAPQKDDILTEEGLAVDTRRHVVTVDGREVQLTLKEFEVLAFLMGNRGTAFSRETLLSKIWDYGYDGGTRTVDVHIQTLRAKLGSCGSMIKTVRGVGYRFDG